MIARPDTDHRHRLRRVAHATPFVCLNAANERVGTGHVPLQSVECAVSIHSAVHTPPSRSFTALKPHACSSIGGRRASGFLQVSLSKVPRHQH
jgi:hypothetical protein